ncbi:hypothetical protein BURMUCF1_1368 [Burkholderia multivorans ATCC BAA-247]|nr:hypothetical protein BURMUCF1_1368 [Burkholderia multivorans ATCC BAA-247]
MRCPKPAVSPCRSTLPFACHSCVESPFCRPARHAPRM